MASRTGGVGNLPAELTSFVGRERELRDVVARLAGARLVSLVGPGGVGKSRLAARAASRAARAFPDGGWLVDLGALRDASLLAAHLAATLGVRDESGRWIVATLADYVATRRLIIVLDNCEHLLDSTAVLVKSLLQQAPALHIVATSRQPLGITGESLVHVSPLDPDSAALQLLRDRASSVRPGFELTDRTWPIARELCRRLDGIPLAIELAAARLRGMALEEVASRLDNRLALLTTGEPSAPERQQTLRATLDWSYDLLGDDERALWRRLSVFAGTFDRDAVEAVAVDGRMLGTPDIADALARLVERSVVQLDDPVVGRYRLLDTLREYGTERAIASGEAEGLALRHRDYYLDLARRAARTWGTAEQVTWFRRLAADYDNLRQALDRCRETPESAALGLDVTARLGIAWQAIGRVGEGQRWISTFLSAAPESSSSRPRGLWASGYMALARRDLGVAEADLTEARARAAALGDEETESWAIGHLGLRRLFEGRPEEARALFLDSVGRHRLGGRRGVAAFMLSDAALCASMVGQTDVAIAEFVDAVAESSREGDAWTESHARWGLGVARLLRGEGREAEAELIRALELIRAVGDATGTALAVEGLALAAAQLGHPRRAASLAGLADAIWGSIPARPPGPATELRSRAIGLAEAELGEEHVAALLEQGRSTDPTTAIAKVLGEMQERATTPAPRPDKPSLSKREQEVALFVARGLTNRQIADRLVLSPRTVESHVERIMNRLTVGSRAEIAAWASRNLEIPESFEIP